MACSNGYHEQLKLDDIAWGALDYVGIQLFPGEDVGDPDERYELRNCKCGSTLAKRMS